MKDMITFFGGLRFRYLDLFGVKCVRLLLGACADTLEGLRLYPTDPYGESFRRGGVAGELKPTIHSGLPSHALGFRSLTEFFPSDAGDYCDIDHRCRQRRCWFSQNRALHHQFHFAPRPPHWLRYVRGPISHALSYSCWEYISKRKSCRSPHSPQAIQAVQRDVYGAVVSTGALCGCCRSRCRGCHASATVHRRGRKDEWRIRLPPM